MYYDLYTQQRRIPIIFLIAIIILVFFLLFLLKQSKTKTPGRQGIEINKFEIGNVTPGTVAIYWRSNIPITGYVKYGTDAKNLDQSAYNNLDINNQLNQRQNHLITIKNLASEQTYYFTFILNGEQFNNIDNQPFNFKTAQKTNKTTQYSSIYGKVINEKDIPITNAIVILRINNALPLISATKDDGSFLLSVRSIFSVANLEPITELDNSKVKLETIDEDGNILKIEAAMTDISPNVGKIVLKKGKSSLFAKNNQFEQKLNQGPTKIPLEPFDIIYPINNSSIPGRQPLYKGTANPNSQITAQINPEKLKFSVTADEKGIWSYNGPQNLIAGEHELIINSFNAIGKKIEKKSKFIVLKSGEAVLGEATPSGTLTPTLPVPTSTTTEPTPPAGGEPTATPEATIIVPPTITTVPINTEAITPGPTTGISDLPTYAIISFGLIVLGMGLIMLF